jgi:hypothetical protein
MLTVTTTLYTLRLWLQTYTLHYSAALAEAREAARRVQEGERARFEAERARIRAAATSAATSARTSGSAALQETEAEHSALVAALSQQHAREVAGAKRRLALAAERW